MFSSNKWLGRPGNRLISLRSDVVSVVPKRAGIGLLLLAVSVVILATIAIAMRPPEEKGTFKLADATMFISDAGSSHGGFEFTASYNITFAPASALPPIQGEIPMGAFRDSIVCEEGELIYLRIMLSVGLGDPLEVHGLYVYFDYLPGEDSVVLAKGGTVIELVKVDQDVVWNHTYDGYYVASWGGYAPDEEIRGSITPALFGLPEHYYIELRLTAEPVPD